MQTADFNVDHFQRSNQTEADKCLLVKFFIKPVEDKAKTKEEGRPIFRDREFVDIRTPGNRDNYVCRPASKDDILRFPEHYKAFQDRSADPVDEGTPLSEWPVMGRSMAEELKFYHVKTVEQLANMADSQVSKFMGLFSMKEKAKLWLKQVESDKPIYDLTKKCEEQEAELARLNGVVADLVSTIEEREPAPKKKRQKKRTKAQIEADELAKILE